MTRQTNSSRRKVATPAALLLPVLVLMTTAMRADDVVTHRIMMATISAAGTDPITSTRTAAIVQAAVFDSINGIEQKYKPIHTDFREPGDASPSPAISAAAAAVLGEIFGDNTSFKIDSERLPGSLAPLLEILERSARS